MFITEAQLSLYKYQANSRYFKESMSYIAKSEFFEFAKLSKEYLNVVLGRLAFLMVLYS